MSPFPVEALDEAIGRIDEAIGKPDAKGRGNRTRGWIRDCNPAGVVMFLSGIRDRLNHVRYTLTDTAHQDWLREGNEAEQVVLRPAPQGGQGGAS